MPDFLKRTSPLVERMSGRRRPYEHLRRDILRASPTSAIPATRPRRRPRRMSTTSLERLPTTPNHGHELVNDAAKFRHLSSPDGSSAEKGADIHWPNADRVRYADVPRPPASTRRYTIAVHTPSCAATSRTVSKRSIISRTADERPGARRFGCTTIAPKSLGMGATGWNHWNTDATPLSNDSHCLRILANRWCRRLPNSGAVGQRFESCGAPARMVGRSIWHCEVPRSSMGLRRNHRVRPVSIPRQPRHRCVGGRLPGRRVIGHPRLRCHDEGCPRGRPRGRGAAPSTSSSARRRAVRLLRRELLRRPLPGLLRVALDGARRVQARRRRVPRCRRHRALLEPRGLHGAGLPEHLLLRDGVADGPGPERVVPRDVRGPCRHIDAALRSAERREHMHHRVELPREPGTLPNLYICK